MVILVPVFHLHWKKVYCFVDIFDDWYKIFSADELLAGDFCSDTVVYIYQY